jgi:hypothetical protein
MEKGSGAEKEEPFEEGMIPDVEQSAGKGEGSNDRQLFCCRQDAETEPHKDDADILHRRISEGALDVFLQHRHGNAVERSEQAEGENDGSPEWRKGGEEGESPQNTEETGIDNEAGHEGRDMTRGC